MQFRHFFVCLVSVLSLFAALPLNAQKVVTNQNGDKIIIYADGSWRYYEGEEELITDPADGSEWIGEEGKKGKKRKKRKKKRKSSSSIGLSNSNQLNPEVEEQARQQAILYAERAKAELSRLEDEQSQARLQKDELESKLKVAQTDVNTSVEDLIALEEEFKLAKSREQSINAKVKEARKSVKQAERMIPMTKEKRDKYMARLNGEKIERIGPKKSDKSKKRKKSITDMEEDRFANSFSEEKGGWKMDKDDDVMLHPPGSPCKIASEGVDEFTGRRRKELEAQLLFAHTRDELKPYLKERDYITCIGAVSAVSGAGKYLDLEFTIASDMAQREFGVLDKGSSIIIKFISGATVRLVNTQTDIGVLDKVNKRVTYKGQYTISGSQEKSLRKEEVDRIRVVWGTGYEDYEVYELDFFSDQLKCLN
ncbi:MAG: hypothetical protein AAF990_01630 [Bacteroidota bacterium]